MRLRTALDDLQAILLVEIPRSLRFVVVVVCVLVAYTTGLAWTRAVGYQTEVVRLEGQAEVRELRKQVEHLWGAFEYAKTAADRAELVAREVKEVVRDRGPEDRAELRPAARAHRAAGGVPREQGEVVQ